jgi:hypothetical protein
VLTKIFGSKLNEIAGKWRRLHNEELYDLYPSTNVIRVIKSRGMELVGHMACMGQRRKEEHTKFGWRDLKERDHLEGLGMAERVKLIRISKKWNIGAWTRFI